MDRRDYHASCAVCNGPADPDCPSGCESNRLNIAIAQAETQWLEKWTSETREWVANHAIRHVTSTFQAMKEARLANHNAYVQALPYFAIYEQYHGRPPLHPGALHELKRQMAEADMDLRRSIDADWRQCVVRYPDVLAHYYSMVNIVKPKEVASPSNIIPPVPHLLPQTKPAPIERARSTTGTTAAKKARRNSKASSIKGSDFTLDAISKLLRDSQLESGGNPKASLSGNLQSGIGHGNFSNNMTGGLPASLIDKLQSGYSRGVTHGLSNGIHASGTSGLEEYANLLRSASKAGRTTPVQETPPARPSGKKRHNKDSTSSSGRATAPLPYAPYAPPGQGWINGHFVP